MRWDRQAAQAAWDAKRVQEREIAGRLAEWLEAEGIAKGDVAADVADTLSESAFMREQAAVMFEAGDAPQALRDAAIGVAVIASLTPEDLAAELFWHGHDPY